MPLGIERRSDISLLSLPSATICKSWKISELVQKCCSCLRRKDSYLISEKARSSFGKNSDLFGKKKMAPDLRKLQDNVFSMLTSNKWNWGFLHHLFSSIDFTAHPTISKTHGYRRKFIEAKFSAISIFSIGK